MVNNYKRGCSMIGSRAQCGQSGACHGIAIENKLPSEQVCGDDSHHSACVDRSRVTKKLTWADIFRRVIVSFSINYLHKEEGEGRQCESKPRCVNQQRA